MNWSRIYTEFIKDRQSNLKPVENYTLELLDELRMLADGCPNA